MLRAERISFYYDHTPVLEEVNLRVDEGDTLSIQGISGSGKTTLLKVIAGLERENKGKVYLDHEDITRYEPEDRNVVYLSQEPLLFPHLTVFENIAFGLRVRNMDEKSLEERVRGLIRRLGLEGLSNRNPEKLSGGQKQRVAFGRALIVNPDLLLLDEPFVSLDRSTREQMQQLFKEVVHEWGITSLFVTHNVKEAIIMGDYIALLKQGQLHQYESIQAFIEDPQSGVKEEKSFWESL